MRGLLRKRETLELKLTQRVTGQFIVSNKTCNSGRKANSNNNLLNKYLYLSNNLLLLGYSYFSSGIPHICFKLYQA